MTAERFEWLNPGELVDRDLKLILIEKAPGKAKYEYVPAYIFEMQKTDTLQKMGRINLRVGNTEHITMYAGHIGYNVYSQFRGNRYAARSCRLLFPLAKHHGLNPLWITCNPENIASKRTLEIAGGTFVEIVDVPEDNEIYKKGDLKKCRFRFDI